MKNFIITLIISLSVLSNIFPQSLQHSLSDNITENVVLITDRDFYITGESIWFTAKIFSSYEIQGQQLSNVLYVELFNTSKQAFIRKKFKIIDNAVSGMIEVPKEINSGNYLLRTYTLYQRNSLPETFTTIPLTIINPLIKLPEQVNVSEKIKILPEFGSLVANSNNKIAINYGLTRRDMDISAWIMDNTNNKVAKIQVKNGLGLIDLKPALNNSYTLYSKIENDTIATLLPKVINEGLFINVISSKYADQLELRTINYQTKVKQLKVELLSKHLNKIKQWSINLMNDQNNILIPEIILQTGFNYFVVRDEADNIVAAQCYYKYYDSINNIRIQSDKEIYHPRNKIELDLFLQKEESNELNNVTVSVIKKEISPNHKPIIPNYLMHNPMLLDAFLANNSMGIEKTHLIIDTQVISVNNKLATNSEFLNKLTNFKYDLKWIPEIRDVSLSGYVLEKSTHKPVSNAEVYASVFMNNPQVHTNKTDEDGFFLFSLNNLTETQNVFISINDKMNDSIGLDLFVNYDFSREYPSLEPYPISIDTNQIPIIEQFYINSQTSKIFKTDAKNKEPIPNILPYSFTDPEFSIDLDDYVANPSLEIVFRELIPDVKIRQINGKYRLSVTDPQRRKAQREPLVMVDYITIFDINELLTINPADIQKIDIYTTPYILGDSQFDGVILLTTKTDNFGGMKMPPESVFFEYTTISDSYNFIPPSYENDSKLNSRLPDFRNLLYWQPHLSINNHRKISFYASDHCSEYEILVRGISKEGKPYFGKHQFEIKK